MKKVLLLVCITLMGTGISAQSDTRHREFRNGQDMRERDIFDGQDSREQQIKLDHNYHDQRDTVQVELRDGYVCKKGRMMVVDNGMTSVMKKETTLENGTVLAINGDYTIREGKPTKLQPGQHMDADGAITTYETPVEGE